MPVVCAGINHNTAPLALRERLAFSDGDQHELFSNLDLECFEQHTGIGELALLSTCNRVEIYGASHDAGRVFSRVPSDLLKLLVNGRAVDFQEVQEHAYGHRGSAAVRHLGGVAAGLNSMVLGEPQILGQVQAAHERAQEDHVAGPVLGEVFHTAIRVGRRARAETQIARKPVSVSSEAVCLAERISGPLRDKRILIVGSGKMGRLGGRVLRDKGVGEITVVNRTAAHAESLAAEWGARALGWHHLATAIRDADIVFTSTSAPHAVITTELVSSAHGAAGRSRPLLLLDLAVPRDVESGVRDLPHVQVIDIDEIKQRLQGNMEHRENAVPAVEAILDDEVQRFEEWRWQQAELRPLMTAMRSRTDEIRRRELDRMMRKMGDISPEVRMQLERFSRSLVNKVLHEPTRRLKEETDPTRCSTYAKVTRELFGLPADERMRAAGGM